MEVNPIFPSQSVLAEGPLWHPQRMSCFWVDIEGGILYEYGWKTREVQTWSFDYKVTMVIQGVGDTVILALNRSIAKFDLKTEDLEWLADLESGKPNNRCNDGAADSRGRLWVGTMDMNTEEGAGGLYCLSKVDDEVEVEQKLDNISISNGLAWTKDDKTFYYIDTPMRQVQNFSFDNETGNIVFEKIAIEIPEDMGSPDGMAIDKDGMLWIAHYGGAGVYRWNPNTGEFIEKISVPAPHVTSCAFVGPDLDGLLITTARENMDEEELAKYPQSGDVFYAKTQVKGELAYTCPW